MTENDARNHVPKRLPQPDCALKRLEKLIGTWDMKGRTLEASEDNITGQNTFEWMLDGFFLKSSGEISFKGLRMQSLEIIAYDPTTQTFPSRVYSNMSGAVLPYAWDVQGNQVTHWTDTAKYTGTFSDDGNTLIGGWRPIDGGQGAESAAYDAVMTRAG